MCIRDSLSARVGSDGGERDGLQPPGVTFDHSEEVHLTLRLRKGSHNIQMERVEAMVRHFQRGQGGLDVSGNLGLLAGKT